MRALFIALPLLWGSLAPTHAAVNVGIGIGLPGVSIGVNFPVFPRLVPVPGYPVYYDPQGSENYFFYDGLYWVYRDDNWYQSGWYNGPWQSAGPEFVPAYVLRVPVRYYRRPPVYFRGWAMTRPPRWGEHWGRNWEARRVGWDRWDHRERPVAAPLPTYQRQYSGDRYPREAEQQHTIRTQNYRYQPREAVAKQSFEQRGQADPPSAKTQAPTKRDPGELRDHSQAPAKRDPAEPRAHRREAMPEAADNAPDRAPGKAQQRESHKAEARAKRHEDRAEERGKKSL
jgi:hypothetical protein